MNQARITLKCEIIAVETIDNPTDEEAYELGKLIYENGCLGRLTELSEEQCAQLNGEVPTETHAGAKGALWLILSANGIDPDKALIIKVNQ